MKRHVQEQGVRNWAGDDLLELQHEPLKLLDEVLGQYGPCIVQGCGITSNADGTVDIAAGIVALEATDRTGPEPITRVMAMPFIGESGVRLPVYLTALEETVYDTYGDGIDKPIAYSYYAVASQTDPGAVPHLTLDGTAVGLLDALQDADHRFVTDPEREKWNGIPGDIAGLETDLRQKIEEGDQASRTHADELARSIRSEIATGDEAALRSAKSYADGLDAASRRDFAAADTEVLRQANQHANEKIAALVDNSPEALDTLSELAAALGNDPNFSTTIMEMIGLRVKTEDFDRELAKKLNTTGGTLTGRLEFQLKGTDSQNRTFDGRIWIGMDSSGTYINNMNSSGGALSQLRLNNDHTITFYGPSTSQSYEIWHAYNFDPASKLDTTANAVSATKLQTARTINGAAFDGTAPVTFGTLYPVEIADYTDLNTIQQPGMYYFPVSIRTATLTNCPTDHAFSLLVERAAGTVQTITEYLPLNPKTYRRNIYLNSWGAWYRVYTTIDPPPVATQTSNGLMSAADKKALDTFGNLEIGGRNLLLGSENVTIKAEGVGATLQLATDLVKGETYTLTYEETDRVVSGGYPQFYLWKSVLDWNNLTILGNISQKKITFEWKLETGRYLFSIYNHDPATQIAGYMKNIKLERGSMATAWTPAPEDKADVDHTHEGPRLLCHGHLSYTGSLNWQEGPITVKAITTAQGYYNFVHNIGTTRYTVVLTPMHMNDGSSLDNVLVCNLIGKTSTAFSVALNINGSRYASFPIDFCIFG